MTHQPTTGHTDLPHAVGTQDPATRALTNHTDVPNAVGTQDSTLQTLTDRPDVPNAAGTQDPALQALTDRPDVPNAVGTHDPAPRALTNHTDVPHAVGTHDSTLQTLTDRAEVLDVVGLCALSMDLKDWAAVESCFAEDAEIHFGGRVGTITGNTAVAEALRRTLDNLDSAQHLLTSPVVRTDGDMATHVGYLQATHRRGDELYTIGARYDDVLRRTPDGWRLSGRVVTRLWKTGDPNVIRPETD
ncbi:nuclear transport factor 2 family protein [Lentzea sp. NPDC051838]|uniref:nuclear transport factor 2 family protein n=1 Tax=Lentzea sp. NPDC051838 TaxID=3154849 RepID=UPI0034211801